MPDYLNIFNNSLDRIGECEEDLVTHFYEVFLKRSPRAVEKFRNTDMERQKQILSDSFRHMLTFSTRRRTNDELEQIATRHSRADLDIAPNLYDEWLDSLVAAVQDLDLNFDRDVETAWRIVMAPGIVFMKSRHVP